MGSTVQLAIVDVILFEVTRLECNVLFTSTDEHTVNGISRITVAPNIHATTIYTTDDIKMARIVPLGMSF